MIRKNTKEIIIRPISPFILIDFHELWQSRELLFMLAWRDIKIRYKQTLLGIAWVVFQPLVNTVIFSFFFGKVAKIPSGSLPYPLFVLSGLVYWTFFSNALTNASSSLVVNEDIIKKVYFPKIIAPLATIIPTFLDFFINFLLLGIALIIYARLPSLLSLVIIPLGIVITLLTIAGIGIFFAAVNVKYRDVRYILPFFIQLFLFITPVIYPTSILRKDHLYLIALNPMTGVIDSLRTVISGSNNVNYAILAIGFVSSILIFCTGLYYFHKTERYFADVI
jgi:lipopolysaccharide transport system permease protein